jgi:hypothetical protein
MNRFLGPLDSTGRVPPLQQTRVASFLVSAHGALARRLAMSLPGQLKAEWQAELNGQLHREAEIVSLLMRSTAWLPDFALPYHMLIWEGAWMPQPVAGVTDPVLMMTIDIAALGHAVHGAIRPAALLPVEASADDAFVTALRRIEFESGRLIQAQIHFLKGDDLKPVRDAVSAAVERRHHQVRKLWADLLASIGITRDPDGEWKEP